MGLSSDKIGLGVYFGTKFDWGIIGQISLGVYLGTKVDWGLSWDKNISGVSLDKIGSQVILGQKCTDRDGG